MTIQGLIELGVNMNHPDTSGNTPLMYAAILNDKFTIKTMAIWGANLSDLNNDGYTALDLATMEGNQEAAQILTELGAPKTIDAGGSSSASHCSRARVVVLV
jgi:ankyrin repeat protein